MSTFAFELSLSLSLSLLDIRLVSCIILQPTDVEHVVAPNEHFAQRALEVPIHPLLSVDELQIHVLVDGTQISPVLHAPLQLRQDLLARQVVEERLRVQWNAHLHLNHWSLEPK